VPSEVKMYFSALLLVILTGIALGENCCGCWDRCFQQSLDADKQLFYNMINKLRGVKIAYDIKGIMIWLICFISDLVSSFDYYCEQTRNIQKPAISLQNDYIKKLYINYNSTIWLRSMRTHNLFIVSADFVKQLADFWWHSQLQNFELVTSRNISSASWMWTLNQHCKTWAQSYKTFRRLFRRLTPLTWQS